jgi:hypothetical protein
MTWRRLAMGTGVLFVLAVLAYTGLFFLSGLRVEREIARLEQRFGNLGESSLIVEAIPPDENRALLIREAAALTDWGYWTANSASITRYFHRDSAVPVPSEARAMVNASRAAIAMAEQVTLRSRSNYEVDYRQTRGRTSREYAF